MLRTPLALLLTLSSLPPAVAAEDRIDWRRGTFDAALARGREQSKDVLVYFWVDGNPACVRMYEETLKTDGVAEAAEAFVCFAARRGDPVADALFDRYNIDHVPAVRVVDGDGELVDGRNGYFNVPVFKKALERIAAGEETLVDLRARAEQRPEDLDLRLLLGNKLSDLGDPDAYARIVASVREDDPTGRTSAGARLHLDDAIAAVRDGATRPDELDVARLYALAETVVPSDVLYQCWSAIAQIENVRGDLEAQFAAYDKALPHVPDGSLFNWGYQAALEIWSHRDVASRADKQIALKIARRTAEVSEALSEEDPDYYDPSIFLTRRLDALARCLYMNGKKKEAIATAQRCVDLGHDDTHSYRLDAYRSGGDDRVFRAHRDIEPVWSPDGKKVLFASDRHGDFDLYVADVLREKVTRVTRWMTQERAGAFAPNGRDIVMTSDRMGGPSLYGARLGGKDDRVLFASDAPRAQPAFDSRGRRVAYVTVQDDRPVLAVADADGGGERLLEGTDPDPDSRPVWWGRRVLFATTASGRGDLSVVDPETGEVDTLPLALQQSRELDPDISPDGRRLVFALFMNGKTRIYAAGVDGGDLVELTETAVEDRHPRFSPDGRRIVFSRRFPDGTIRLWLMDADGGNARPLLAHD